MRFNEHRLIAIAFGLLLSSASLAAEPRPAAELQAMVDKAIAAGHAELVVPPGEYRGPAVAGAVLTIDGAVNLALKADGVRLVATTLHPVVSIVNSKGLNVRGLTIDLDPLPFTQGEVIAVAGDGLSFEVKVHDGYDSLDANGRRAIIHDASTGYVKPGTWSRYNTMVESIGDGVLRVTTPRPFKDDLTVGDLASLNKPTIAPHGILVYDSRDCTFENVTVNASTTFAIFERGGGGNAYLGCRVEPGPAINGHPRLLASNADGIHSKHTDIGPRIENCTLFAMGDDGIAINGDYALVLDADDTAATIVVKREPTFFVGDRVHAFNESGKRTNAVRVASIVPISLTGGKSAQQFQAELFPQMRKADDLFRDAYRVTFASSVGLEPGDLLSSPDRNGSGFVVRGNTIRHHRARGILVKASDGVIENNDVEGSSICGILMAPEVDVWTEADFSSDVVIRGNRIAGVNHGIPSPGSSYAGAITIVAPTTDAFWPAGGHRKLTIEGNTIENSPGPQIVLTSAADVTIAGNTFIRAGHGTAVSGSRYGIDPAALIWLSDVRDVELRDNEVVEPGAALGKVVVVAGESADVRGIEHGVEVVDQ